MRAGDEVTPQFKKAGRRKAKRSQDIAAAFRVNTAALDKQWSIDVRKRDGKCRRCNSTENLAAHHIVSRRYRPLRHVLENGVTLCWRCHPWVHEHVEQATSLGYIKPVWQAQEEASRT